MSLDKQLHVAARNGDAAAVESLLEQGASPNALENGYNPLTVAAAYQHAPIVRMLAECGADIDNIDAQGWSPLFRAAVKGHVGIINVLLENGADLMLCDHNEWTPLHWACAHGYVDVAKLLLDYGAQWDAMNATSHTCWDVAANDGIREVIEVAAEDRMKEYESFIEQVPKAEAAALPALPPVAEDVEEEEEAPHLAVMTPIELGKEERVDKVLQLAGIPAEKAVALLDGKHNPTRTTLRRTVSASSAKRHTKKWTVDQRPRMPPREQKQQLLKELELPEAALLKLELQSMQTKMMVLQNKLDMYRQREEEAKECGTQTQDNKDWLWEKVVISVGIVSLLWIVVCKTK